MSLNKMFKVGITGNNGFIGTHLTNYLCLQPDNYTLIPFEDAFFSNHEKLEEFVCQCDCVIHLAALNRHQDPEEIYKCNIELVKNLISALEKTKSTPHVLFASSTQEYRDNVFGNSKREGRMLLSKWAEKHDAVFTGLIIPNVFGPFGQPFYNSVVATFCHQLIHNQKPSIDIDAELKLIYIGELAEHIQELIKEPRTHVAHEVPYSSVINVSGILSLLNQYSDQYLKQGIIPETSTALEYNLFNTFMNYNELKTYYPINYSLHSDERGGFVELLKSRRGGQFSFSTTKSGVTRGNHYHTRKIERFSVIKGKAIIRLRRVGTVEVIEYNLDGKEPSYVDIPIWYTHNITNCGDDELLTVFWINEFYNPEDPDTYYEKV